MYPPGPLLYLRVIPIRYMPPLRRAEIKDIVYGINLHPLASVGDGSCWELNRYGGITFSYSCAESSPRYTSSQVFPNREIWGVDGTIIRGRVVPIVAVEECLETGLKHYLQVARERLGLKCPLVIEAGAVVVSGYRLLARSEPFETAPRPISAEDIRCRQTLRSFEETAVDRVLLTVFEEFFDAVAERRPERFRDFPPIASSG